MNKILKDINKIEIFVPKRTYNAPRNPNAFVHGGTTRIFKIKGLVVTVQNVRTQNCYVRLK